MSQAPVPVLLVTGFLGAGKTTVLNAILADAGERRIAAVVNDFGAINIDAELIAGAVDGVVDLSNGCICCSLQGDLLRTLATLLRRTPRPEAVVIETSGIADPGDVVRTLMDPVIWREAPLETVLCVVDASDGAAPRLDDALLRSQVRAADIVALSKTDLAAPGGVARVQAGVKAIRPGVIVVEAAAGHVPMALLFPDDPVRSPRDPGRARPVADRFETVAWTSDEAVSLPLLQATIGRLAPRLVRAKGFFESEEQRGRPWLLQFAGGRATLAPARLADAGRSRARFVFIVEIGTLPALDLAVAMEGCVVPCSGKSDR